ncbi:hypothetical protein GCM10010401_13890 [Rarobacter faecitabidus]
MHSVLLDTRNARHEPVQTQPETIASLLGDPAIARSIVALAEDICEYGIDPSSLPILEPKGKGWRVLEGNRRFTVLKCLANPDLIVESALVDEKTAKRLRKKFTDLAKKNPAPTKVAAVITEDREYADHLIELKHTNQAQHRGAGTMTWDAAAKIRHDQEVASRSTRRPRGSSPQARRASGVLDLLASIASGNANLSALIANARKHGLTTLGRLLGKPEHQERLGVRIDKARDYFVEKLVSDEALLRAFTKVLGQLGSEHLNSRVINTNANLEGYLNRISSDLPAPGDYLTSDSDSDEDSPVDDEPGSPGEPDRDTSGGGDHPNPDGDPEPDPKPKPRPKPDITQPFAGLHLHTAGTKTQQVLAELQALRIDRQPYSCVVMTRVFIELFVGEVLNSLKGLGEPVTHALKKEDLGPRVARCLELLEGRGVSPRARKFPAIHDHLSNGAGELSVAYMHSYVHRTDYYADREAVRNQTRHYQPFLEALDLYVANAQNRAAGHPASELE